MSQKNNILKEIEKLKGYKHFDVNSEWEDFLSLTETADTNQNESKQDFTADTAGKSNVFRLWPAIAVAASLLLLFGAYNTFWNQDETQFDIVEEPIKIEEPVIEEIIVEVPEIVEKPKTEVIAEIPVKVDDPIIEEPIVEEPKEEVIAEIPVKQEITYPIIDGNVITLEDLTKITLVGNPDISYPPTFKGQTERVVEITNGEALFDVAEHEIPFKVIVGDAGIRVLGTIFKTMASSGKAVVENLEGSVKFYEIADENNAVILEVGDKIEFDGETFKNLNEEPKDEKEVEETNPVLNKGQYTAGSVLNLLKSSRSKFYKQGKKLKVKDSDTLSIDIDSNLPLEVLLQQFVEAFPNLEYVKGDCEDCLILRNKE